jgi:hypothetical protein
MQTVNAQIAELMCNLSHSSARRDAYAQFAFLSISENGHVTNGSILPVNYLPELLNRRIHRRYSCVTWILIEIDRFLSLFIIHGFR